MRQSTECLICIITRFSTEDSDGQFLFLYHCLCLSLICLFIDACISKWKYIPRMRSNIWVIILRLYIGIMQCERCRRALFYWKTCWSDVCIVGRKMFACISLCSIFWEYDINVVISNVYQPPEFIMSGVFFIERVKR